MQAHRHGHGLHRRIVSPVARAAIQQQCVEDVLSSVSSRSIVSSSPAAMAPPLEKAWITRMPSFASSELRIMSRGGRRREKCQLSVGRRITSAVQLWTTRMLASGKSFW